jgi:hypothetical protein
MLQHYLLAIESPLTEGTDYLAMFNDLVGTSAEYIAEITARNESAGANQGQ